MYTNITGAILAGGKSSRMGTDKAFLKIGNLSFIEKSYKLLSSVFSEVIVIANDKTKYENFDCRIFGDIHKNRGPLGGIHSALMNSKTERNFILSCDLPFIEKGTIEYVVDHKSNAPIIVPALNSFIQPLCAVYTKSCIAEIEKMISVNLSDKLNKNFSFTTQQLFNRIETEIVEISKFEMFDEKQFFNVNTKEDYKILLSEFKNF